MILAWRDKRRLAALGKRGNDVVRPLSLQQRYFFMTLAFLPLAYAILNGDAVSAMIATGYMMLIGWFITCWFKVKRS